MWLRIRRGDSGMLPIIVGLIALCIYFESRSSTFITVANLNNLVIQATVFVLLGMAEIWLLLLGEIDLSLGFVAGLSGAVSVVLVDLQFHWAWYLALGRADGNCYRRYFRSDCYWAATAVVHCDVGRPIGPAGYFDLDC